MDIKLLERLAPYLPMLKDARCLEVGSRYVNGSIRPFAELFTAEYIGTDIQQGKHVDILCDVEHIENVFGRESFDAVLCLETLEHVLDWKAATKNIAAVLKVGGTLMISAPAVGMPYHGYPTDYWRFEPEDLQRIFGKFDIVHLSKAHRITIIVARKTADAVAVCTQAPRRAPPPPRITPIRAARYITRKLLGTGETDG